MQVAMPHLLHNHLGKAVCVFPPFAHKVKRFTNFTKGFPTSTTLKLTTVKIQEYSPLADAQISHSMPMILM
jgi:hypothetical protein